jgi:pimeloyl-ACP methyl ester carboxylesterase
MATPTPRHSPDSPPAARPPKQVLEVVDPRWLLKALGLLVVSAGVLAYGALCLLVRIGSWQFFLHPSAVVDAKPAAAFQNVRFDAAATGTPRLTAWWIPADSTTQRTILYLHDGTGSLSNNVRTLDLLHTTGVNLFAIDYRGFGASDGPHPTEISMQQDADAAVEYLTGTRKISTARIIPYGTGLGAAIAVHIVAAHPGAFPALILDTPDAAARDRALADSRFRLLPTGWLVQEHFDLAEPLRSLTTPKLLLANAPFANDPARTADNQALFRTAHDPRMVVTFSPGAGTDVYVRSVTRFLDENTLR